MTTISTAVDTDIDIDFGNRDLALAHLKHVNAIIAKNDGTVSKHASGAYFTDIPHDINNQSTIDYKAAEARGYFKLDLLNVSVYEKVTSDEHMDRLLATEPDWNKLLDKQFCEQLIHIGSYHNTICNLPEPINSIPRLAMFLALIRPSKKHLIGQPWSMIAQTIWDKPTNGDYYFKHAHAVSYAHLVYIHMNLLLGIA